MAASHEVDPIAIPSIEALRKFLLQPRSREPGSFQQFEIELHERLSEVEREMVGSELAHYDVDADRVEVGGIVYRRSIRCPETYTSAAGPVRVLRTLYAPSAGGATECPLELRAGIMEGRWTPRAAELVAFTMAKLTPAECEELFRKVGGMCPSRSSLDRLPRKLSERWEAGRRLWEDAIRATEVVPREAEVVALSLDGVMIPMRTDAPEAAANPHPEDGDGASDEPTNRVWKEAGCATVSLYDGEGERLETRRWGRMPQHKKVDLQEQLADEYAALQGRGLKVAKLSDGAEDNWRLLNEVEPGGTEILDFHHGTDHLADATGPLWGEGTVQARAEWERLKTILRDEPGGVDTMIAELTNRARRHRSRAVRQKVGGQIRYFRKNRHRMDYARYQREGMPIGTGVTEATCKTLAGARLKRSGMSWRKPGGQAVLTFRSLQQSNRWDRGWEILAALYRKSVKLVDENSHMDLAA